MDGHEAARGVSFLSLVEKQTCHWWEVWRERLAWPAHTKYFKIKNFEIFIKISNYLALNFLVTIQNVMLFFILRPVNIINLCPLLNGKIKQARDASMHHRNEAANERQHKHKKSHDKRLLNVDR
jgi:hypothetical protein